MNAQLLIDAIVRQTTVLLAQLATASGARAQLAKTANQIFLDLVNELREQGVGNKVIADMFGLSLRTYYNKVQRLTESQTYAGQSLWEAILSFVQQEGPIARAQVQRRFRRDDDASVRAVLRDLVETGLLFRSGRGDLTVYRAAEADDHAAVEPNGDDERIANIVWVAVHRFGPATRGAIAEHMPIDDGTLKKALDRLVTDGRLVELRDGDTAQYRSERCVMPQGIEHGWEAAVLDHYQAVVTTICSKLRTGSTRSVPGEYVGGSTYGFDVWKGHPKFDEVMGFLQATRDRAVALRGEVEAYNASHAPLGDEPLHVVAYVGQTVFDTNEDDGGET